MSRLMNRVSKIEDKANLKNKGLYVIPLPVGESMEEAEKKYLKEHPDIRGFQDNDMRVFIKKFT